MGEVIPYIAIVLSVLIPLVTFYGGLRKQEGAREVWERKFEESTKEWRATVTKHLDGLDKRINLSSQAVLAERVNTQGREVTRLRKWRHLKADPHLNDIVNINARMMALEAMLAKHADDDEVVAAAVTVLQARMAGRDYRERGK